MRSSSMAFGCTQDHLKLRYVDLHNAMAFVTDNSGWRGRLSRFWQRTYAADYVGLALIVLAYIMIQLFVEPFHRMFSLDDRSKAYPHAVVQRVSAGQNIVYAGCGSLILLVVWLSITRPGFHTAHVTILGFLISVFLTSLLTDIVKNAVGRPRPDLIARCKPRLGTPKSELVTIDVCTETDHHVLHDGWRSFPSGHSSFAFSSLGYLALFIAGQGHVFRPGKDLTRTILFFAPLVGAALIAMSRLADYRHDVFDVTVGSGLGMLIAHFSYRRYFRRLRHPKCHDPYPSPSAGRKSGRDEEQRGARAEDFELEDIDDDEQILPLAHR